MTSANATRATQGEAAAPLKPADDAVLLDTTHLTIDEAVDRVLALYRAGPQST